LLHRSNLCSAHFTPIDKESEIVLTTLFMNTILGYSMQKDNKLIQIQDRLKRVSGQIDGINRMIDDGRSCPDIIQQIIAVRSALASVGMEVAINESTICKSDSASENSNSPDKLEKMVKSLFKLS
jgi:CsoR family transcriptional regulator, copper-sensing transcriptional repressor